MDPILGGMLISGGVNLLGGALGKSGADKAARAAEEAARLNYQAAMAGIGEQRRQYDRTRADFAPYRTAGDLGIGQYQTELMRGTYDAPGFDYTPGEYQYDAGADQYLKQAIDKANRAIEASAAARGVLGGGGVIRAINRETMANTADAEQRAYSRFREAEANRYGMATDKYSREYGARQDRANRFLGLGQMGLGAAGQVGQFGASAASNIGELGIRGANARAIGMQDAARIRNEGNMGLVNALGQTGSDIASLWAMRGIK